MSAYFILTQTITDLDAFREDTRAWLEENCPESMRTPVMNEEEVCWGGRKAPTGVTSWSRMTPKLDDLPRSIWWTEATSESQSFFFYRLPCPFSRTLSSCRSKCII